MSSLQRFIGIKLESCEAKLLTIRIKALHLIAVHLWCEAETNIHLSQVQFQLYFAV